MQREGLAASIAFSVAFVCVFSISAIVIHYKHVEKMAYIKHGYAQIYQGGNLVWVPGSEATNGEIGAAR